MASEWIPVTKSLTRKREVLAIASAAGVTRHEATGRLLDLWFWCDDESSDGKITGVGIEEISVATGLEINFLLAVQQAGWLKVTAAGVEIPNFSRWLGQSSKRRLHQNIYQARWRNKTKCDVEEDVEMFSSTESSTTVQYNTEEKNKEERTPLTPHRGEKEKTLPAITPQEFLTVWNAVPHFINARGLTGKRARAFRQRIRDLEWVTNWRPALRRASESSFCRGENDRGWTATVDWFLRPETVTKLLEGQYDDRPKGKRGERVESPQQRLQRLRGNHDPG